jgi:hypothetical protein
LLGRGQRVLGAFCSLRAEGELKKFISLLFSHAGEPRDVIKQLGALLTLAPGTYSIPSVLGHPFLLLGHLPSPVLGFSQCSVSGKVVSISFFGPLGSGSFPFLVKVLS